MNPPQPPLVLKLGGSLAESGRLAQIAELAAHATIPLVIVPGGGPFADAVRALQPQMRFDDAIAHRLALLAMHQMALVIAAKNPRFMPAATLDDIRAALASHRIPVWLPITLQRADATLPADWTTTSDALAARLAERLGGTPVALVKSCTVPSDASLASLAASTVTDPVFQTIVARARLDWGIYGAGDEPALASRLQPS